MRKIFTLFLITMTFIGLSICSKNSASAKTLSTQSQVNDTTIADINEATEGLIEDVNNQLEEGKSTAIATTTAGDVTITVGLDTNKSHLNTINSLGIATLSAKTTKNYSAFVSYEGIGFDFSHKLYGTYQYSGGKVGSVTAKIEQTGWAYQKSYEKDIQKVDSSVKEVTSTGYFNAFTYGKQYVAYVDVKIFGSGDYKITRAKIK